MNLSDAKAVVQDVFEATGQKIDVDDPLVAAALVNSRVQERAAARSIAAIEAAVRAGVAELAAAANDERAAAAAASESVAAALRDVRASIEAGGDNELSSLRAKFAQTADSVLRDVAGTAREAAPQVWKYRVGMVLGLSALLFALAGGVVGAEFFGRQAERTQDEARQLAAGRDMLAVLPKLDPETHDKVVRMVEQLHRQ